MAFLIILTKVKKVNDILLHEIVELQNNYKAVLLRAADKVFIEDTHAILDEINVFWHRYKKLAQCVFTYLSKPYRTYVFTAATILDIDDYEHYPFLCFGDYHIWDDPIHGYIRMATESSNEKFNSELKEQILATVKDNIKILDKVSDKIFIFPIRMLSGIEKEVIHNAANNAFFNLFADPPNTIEEYSKSFNTIDEITLGLREGVEKNIVLSEDDDSTIELKKRFYEYKSSASLPLPEDASDALIFWFTLYGYLSQAFDIILTCSGYHFIPYIRFTVAFKYLLILSGNLRDVPYLDMWLFKSSIAHIMHKSFDKEKYSKVDFDKFIQTVKVNNFEQRVFHALNEHEISLENPSVQETVKHLSEQLSACFVSK
jgi:hypothetical protein